MSVDVVLSHPWNGHEVGERLSLEDAEARQVINDGWGQPATKSAAKDVGVPTDSAASVRK